jgi:peroxiredoxin
MIVAASLLAPLAAGGADLTELLAGRGLRPVEPPSPAVDFELPRLDGSHGSLSDFRGDWVVLTFWATWCGPCRTEMPTLEQLHRSRQGNGLAVIGISVDQSREAAAAFVEGLDLSFANFWDERGEVGTAYRAASIPLTYLIDPRGGIVGVSRGARDWTALGSLLDAVLAAVPPDPQAEAIYAEGPVELVSISNPPTAEVSLSNPEPRVGKPFHLDIHLLWAGNFEEYLPHPPEVLLPEGVVRESVTASTSSREGRNLVTYRVTLKALKAGSYALDPVELHYTPRFESTPVSSRVPGPTVEVRARTVAGLAPRTFMLTATGVALLGLIGLGAARQWRAGRMPAEGGATSTYERLRASFEQARALRLRGESAGFVLQLAEIEAELGQEEDCEQLDADWQARVEAARYGGEVPSAEEMDRLQRRVERRLESLLPDPEGTVRHGLRFREPTQRSSRPT